MIVTIVMDRSQARNHGAFLPDPKRFMTMVTIVTMISGCR
jgi:hypothetical protein